MVNKNKELAVNTAILTIGRICTQFMSFFLMPLYTAALSTEEYGVVDLVGTYTSLLLPVALLQIDQALFRFLIDKRNDEDGKKYVLTTAAIFSLAQVAVVIAVFLLFGRFISTIYKWYLLCNLIMAIFSSMMLQTARGLGDNVSYANVPLPMSVLLLVSGMFVLSCVSFYSKNTILQIVIFFVIAVVCVIANRSILMEAVRLILGKLNRLMESR